MTKADNSETQRIGAWIPPYAPGGPPYAPGGPEYASTATGPAPHPIAGPSPVPLSRGRSGRPLMVLLAATSLAVLGYGVTAVVVLGTGSARPPERTFVFPEWSPAAGKPPVSVLPSPPAESALPTRDVRKAGNVGTTSPTRAPANSATPARTVTSQPAADPAFTVGRTVGVGVAGRTGYRLRNRDFAVRLEADSAAQGRSGRFVVRQGLADPACLSFESVEFPGFYLRHRNFVLLLERAEPTGLYRSDATFCASVSAGGYALRSVNYPDHYLVQDNGQVRLVRSAAAQATVFRALAPI